MTTGEIIEKTKTYFCYGIEEPDIAIRIEEARKMPSGSFAVDFGTGQARTAITMAMANPGLIVYTFDIGRADMTNEALAERVHHRCVEQNVTNLKYYLGDAKIIVKDWDKPLHLLNIDAEGDYERTLIEVEEWYPHVVSGGTIFMQSYNLTGKYPAIKEIVDKYLEDHLNQYRFGELYHNTKVIYKL